MLCFHRCFYSESHNLILGLESLFPSEFLKQTRSISSMRIANVMFAYYHFLLSENYLNTHIIRLLIRHHGGTFEFRYTFNSYPLGAALSNWNAYSPVRILFDFLKWPRIWLYSVSAAPPSFAIFCLPFAAGCRRTTICKLPRCRAYALM